MPSLSELDVAEVIDWRGDGQPHPPRSTKHSASCDFCGAPRSEFHVAFEGLKGCICEHCVLGCMDRLEDIALEAQARTTYQHTLAAQEASE